MNNRNKLSHTENMRNKDISSNIMNTDKWFDTFSKTRRINSTIVLRNLTNDTLKRLNILF